jgi:ABC-2 type transport system permease protein
MKQQLRTVLIFTKLNTRRFFRDRLAIFFSILFPLIFLFVFGSLANNNGSPTFNVALFNESRTPFARQFVATLKKSEVFRINTTITNLADAKEKMSKSQIDGIITLPSNFGQASHAQHYPTGDVQVLYSASNSSTGQTLASILNGIVGGINNKLIGSAPPLLVKSDTVNDNKLTAFDYTFSGLLGFSIIGIGIFGPINVFPELKKQGILRRLHTTPIRVWQYFMSTMFSQAITGIVAIGIQFAVAISVFNLHVTGNYLEIILFTILSIFMILGIGLAIGGWAKNERQAAPLSNIIVFPMMFLSGTFFPRYLMPDWLQHVATYLPLTPVIDGLRLLTTEGQHLLQIGPQLGEIGLWMVVVYFVAFRVFRWE